MGLTLQSNIFTDDQLYVRLAREIALDHHELEEILKRYGVSNERWHAISSDKWFVSLLSQEIEAWNATTNTGERSKLKAAAIVEDWLPEAHSRLHDEKENLTAKVALATLVTKIAGLGMKDAEITGGGGEKFTVNINLGDQRSLHVSAPVVPVPSIDLEPQARVVDNSALGTEILKKW